MIKGNTIEGGIDASVWRTPNSVVGGDVACIDEDAWYAKLKERRSDADQPKSLARLFLPTQS